jgi:predicted nucleotidyltransferase
MKAGSMNVIDILKSHEEEIKKRFGVRRIGLFGSFARGEQKDTSDVDILVEFEEPTFDNFRIWPSSWDFSRRWSYYA